MKVTCPISGITYFQSLPSRGHTTHPHPMLSGNLKVSQLREWYFKDWQDGKLGDIETHLLGLAYITKLPVESIAFEPMQESQLAAWVKLWAENLERLESLASKLEGKVVKFRRLPRLVVNLSNIHLLPEWLKTLQSELGAASMPISEKAKELNRASYAAGTETSGRTMAGILEPEQIDSLVTRALKGSPLATSEAKALPVILSDWACKVTEFPAHSRMRWQRAIQIIFMQDYINQILMSDINVDIVKSLEEHLILETPEHAVGTAHSSLLMKRIGEVIPVLEDFNPVMSRRRKVDEDSLVGALMGDDSPESNRSRNSTSGASDSGAPKSTAPKIPGGSLLDKLAARLKGGK